MCGYGPLDSRVVVWHGRISIRHKGLDILLEAWDSLCRARQDRDLRLFLVGTGQDAEELQRHLESKPFRGIHWINKYLHDRAEIRRYLSAGDVYAFASRHEGFPVAPLEAMACGLPVVAANVQGIPDIFEGNERSGGTIVPPEDVAALATALGRILDDEALGRELGQRARSRIEAAFSLEAVGEQLCHFLFRTSSQKLENINLKYFHN
jgi:glycosyltransferase involved in cell wall biosynthesis